MHPRYALRPLRMLLCTSLIVMSFAVVLGLQHTARNWPRTVRAAAAVTAAGNGLGEPQFYTFFTQRLSDHKQLRVNVTNGNVVIESTDLHVQGTGLDLLIQSIYNAQATGSSDLGRDWLLNVGTDVNVHVNTDNSVVVTFPGGYQALYQPASGGGYIDPPGVNAGLVHNADGSWTLTFHRTGEQYTFGSGSHLKQDADKNGNKLSYQNGGSPERVTSVTDTHGRVSTFSYGVNTYLATLTDPAGRTAQYSYDTNGNLISETDLNGKTTTYGYFDATGGEVTSITDSLNHTTTITYIQNGIDLASSITDATGAKTTFSYGTGTGCDSGTTGNQVTDANNHTTTYCYDLSTLQVRKVIDGNGHVRPTTYTPNYDVATQADPLGNTTQFQWSTDGKNNLQSVRDGGGATTSFTYNDTSHPYYVGGATDAQGNTLAYTYDSPGNLTTTKDGLAAQNTISRTYNSNGTVATATDARSNTTTYGYDTTGNLTRVTPPSPLGQTTLGYDGLSRVTSVTDGKQQQTSFAYDTLDRITQITYADNATIIYAYDANGNVTSVTDNTGVTTFSYDQDNRITLKTLPSQTQILATYDKVGNLATYRDTSSNGPTVYYAYDAANQLLTLKEPSGTNTFTYDNAGRRTGVTFPNGVTQTITYDGAGHETKVAATDGSGKVLTSFTYSYTKPGTSTLTGLRYSVSDVSGATTNYGYDALNRLTSASSPTASYTYGFDGNGNRTASSANGISTSYSYNAANELTSSVTGGTTTTYSYDGNGNLTNASGGRSVSLSYNAKNQTTAINGTSLTYSGADQTERTQAGTVQYTNSFQGVSGKSDDTGRYFTHYTRDARGGLLAERTPGGTYHYLLDGQGSVVGLTDSTGTLVATYSYDPYGTLTGSTGAQASGNPWRFQSGYADPFSGLYKFGTRYDDPTLGRWTQQDPVGGSLGNPNSLDRYVCMQDNPVNLSDPTGRDIVHDCGKGATIGAIVGFVGGVVTGFLTGALAPPVVWATVLAGAEIGFIVGAITGCLGAVLLDILP